MSAPQYIPKHPASIVFLRLRKDVWAWASGMWLLGMFCLALCAKWVGTDQSPDADRQWLNHRLLPPGSRIQVEQNPIRFPETKGMERETESSQSGLFFLLGTDPLGRDFFSRLALGARISLAIGWMSVCIALAIGLFVGAVSGWFGGWADKLLSFLTNLTWSIPTLLMAMTITLVLGKGLLPVFLAVGLSTWVEIARITRAEIRSLAKQDYVLAAKALGLKTPRLLRKHVFPALIGPLLVASTANFAGAILIESGLSFMGLGVQPPTPTWGSMVEAHRHHLLSGQSHLVWLPGMAIVSVVLSFNLLGNSIKKALKAV